MAVEPIANDRALAPFKEIREITALYPTERFHLLLPTTYMGSSPLFIPTPVVVAVNPDDDRDVYRTPGSQSDVSFHATALQRIANAGGLDFDPSLAMHRHDRKNEPLVCEQTAAAWYIDSLGQRRIVPSGWTTHDLREGSPRANLLSKTSPKALEVARQFICEQCATRAMSRVIRKAMGLQGSYKRGELLATEQVDGKSVTRPKPFVAIRFRLNEADEDVKRALIERGTGVAHEVFGTADTRAIERGTPPGADAMEDIVEGQVVEEEPEIPDDAAAAPKRDVGAVIDAFRNAGKDQPAPASDELLGLLAIALRDVWQLPHEKERLSVARRTFARSVLGATKLKDVTTGQIQWVLRAVKEPELQADLTAIRDFLISQDPEFAKAVTPAQAAA